jgi:hypothetical protein
MGDVHPDLERFLDASDLVELVAARSVINGIDGTDARMLHAIVAQWRDEQAVANLLMYPELLPEDDRTPALAEGLSGVHGDYAVLAAAVGLAGWTSADDAAPAIAERLLAIVADEAIPTPIAVRAAAALIAYAEHVPPTDLVAGLAHADPDVRHNVLAAVLTGWGAVEALDAVAAAAVVGIVSQDVADHVRRAVVLAGLAELDQPLTPAAAPDITEPVLTEIPDLTAWEELTAPAS